MRQQGYPDKIRRELKRVVRQIGQEAHPQKIILFGSYASGKPSRESDIDLLVIMESHLRPAARASQLSRLIHPRRFSLDLMVRTPTEISRRLAIGDQFLEEVLAKGKTLYEE